MDSLIVTYISILDVYEHAKLFEKYFKLMYIVVDRMREPFFIFLYKTVPAFSALSYSVLIWNLVSNLTYSICITA